MEVMEIMEQTTTAVPQEQTYAISQWHDTDEIYARLRALIAQPMRPIRRDKMQQFLSYFDDNCKRSK
ncbi:MAG: aspartate aminotransferase family protein, partial [Anaerolineae bacterium]